MAYAVKVVADSVYGEKRLTTMEIKLPLLAALPLATRWSFATSVVAHGSLRQRLAEVRRDPVEPDELNLRHDHSSMDGKTIWREHWSHTLDASEGWLEARAYERVGGQLLAPFEWTTLLVTSADWSDFFKFQTGESVDSEIRTVAEKMEAVYEQSQPVELRFDQWHTPYVSLSEEGGGLAQLSAVLCARGGADVQDAETEFSRLIEEGNFAPMEHVVTPVPPLYYRLEEGSLPPSVKVPVVARDDRFSGWVSLRNMVIRQLSSEDDA